MYQLYCKYICLALFLRLIIYKGKAKRSTPMQSYIYLLSWHIISTWNSVGFILSWAQTCATFYTKKETTKDGMAELQSIFQNFKVKVNQMWTTDRRRDIINP